MNLRNFPAGLTFSALVLSAAASHAQPKASAPEAVYWMSAETVSGLTAGAVKG